MTDPVTSQPGTPVWFEGPSHAFDLTPEDAERFRRMTYTMTFQEEALPPLEEQATAFPEPEEETQVTDPDVPALQVVSVDVHWNAPCTACGGSPALARLELSRKHEHHTALCAACLALLQTELVPRVSPTDARTQEPPDVS
jgi:hypothetical protein